MKYFDWNEEKNRELQVQRKVTFEDVLVAIKKGTSWMYWNIQIEKKYPGQRILGDLGERVRSSRAVCRR